MTPIEERITEEARKRASEQLNGFSILSALTGFELSPETTIKINGPKAQGTGMRMGSLSVTLSQFDVAFRETLFAALTDKIASRLTEQFVAKTAGVNLSSLE